MTDSKEIFCGIPLTAPLWRGASAELLFYIVESLTKASYHFTDDSTKEWKYGNEAMRDAAAEVNRLKLSYAAIVRLHGHTPQLVSLGKFIDTILQEARG